jgi:hypothetical protein
MDAVDAAPEAVFSSIVRKNEEGGEDADGKTEYAAVGAA